MYIIYRKEYIEKTLNIKNNKNNKNNIIQ
jgi:hypothetical protein